MAIIFELYFLISKKLTLCNLLKHSLKWTIFANVNHNKYANKILYKGIVQSVILYSITKFIILCLVHMTESHDLILNEKICDH